LRSLAGVKFFDEMLPQVLTAEKGISYRCFRPIEKCGLARIDENVAGIQVQMIEAIGTSAAPI